MASSLLGQTFLRIPFHYYARSICIQTPLSAWYWVFFLRKVRRECCWGWVWSCIYL